MKLGAGDSSSIFVQMPPMPLMLRVPPMPPMK